MMPGPGDVSDTEVPGTQSDPGRHGEVQVLRRSILQERVEVGDPPRRVGPVGTRVQSNTLNTSLRSDSSSGGSQGLDRARGVRLVDPRVSHSHGRHGRGGKDGA